MVVIYLTILSLSTNKEWIFDRLRYATVLIIIPGYLIWAIMIICLRFR